MSAQKKVILFLTEGSEEMEFTITGRSKKKEAYLLKQKLIFYIADVLRRAKIEVTVVGVDIANQVAVCSRGVKIAPDVKFQDKTFSVVKYKYTSL
jgi:protein DJ-1